MADEKCVTCEKPLAVPGSDHCNLCWDIEAHLDEYLKSEKGRAFIGSLMGIDAARKLLSQFNASQARYLYERTSVADLVNAVAECIGGVTPYKPE